MKTKRLLLIYVMGGLSCLSINAQSIENGGELFKSNCGICHTIGQGRLVGPDLLGVTNKRSEDWLKRFIKSSQTMINAGDPDAVALYEENNKVLMPDAPISEAEINDVLAFIGDSEGSGAAEYESILEGVSPDDIALGQALFEGRIAFAKKGPSCMSCHNGITKTYFNNNSYARDLGASFSTMGEQAMKGIIENPPFPVMAKAYAQHPLKPEEVKAILAFMQSQDKGKLSITAGGGSDFLIAGLLGSLSLVVLFGGLWYNRKNRSVNHSIYQRQIKSFN